MAVNPDYLETFRRIWEAIRREIKEADVRAIRSRRQAVQKLEGEKERLISSLSRKEKRFFELEDKAEGYRKVGRIEGLERTITGDKFAQSDFDEFVREREAYGEE